MKLWLIRHPQPLVDGGVCYGASDLAADADATARLAQALALALPQGIALACSPLLRCRAAADAVRSLRPDLTPRIDARLRELDFGAWEGQPWDTIARDDLEAWTADFADYAPGGGESAQSLLLRVGEALSEVDTDTAWVTHAGVIRAATLWNGGVRRLASAADWPREAPGFGAWTVLELGAPLGEEGGSAGSRPSPG